MTMVHKLRSQTPMVRVAGNVMVCAVWIGLALVAKAEPPVHYHHAGIMPPGAIGTAQLQRGGPLPGYFQPVEVKAPAGALISAAVSNDFADQGERLLAGFLIGSVYRLRISSIPGQEGMEVFPTVEVIDRLYPPLGQEFRFPIPIELSQEELEMAIAGRFVTRVIYLEDPESALPAAQPRDEQPYFEAPDGENPLELADTLGRPMAILRLGGRLPGPEGLDDLFMYGSPPLLKWKPAAQAAVSQPPEFRLPQSAQTRTASGVRSASHAASLQPSPAR